MTIPGFIPVASLGQAAAGSRVFVFEGASYVTALAKLTCRLVAGGSSSIVAPRPFVARDVLARSQVVDAQEIAVAQARPEVVLLGCAHGRTPRRRVVMRVLRDGRPVLEKAIDVVSPRGTVAGIPIQFDRALGGPGSVDNPLGRGLREGEDPPALLHPVEPGRRVACLAPIPSSFPCRKRRLGETPAAHFDEAVPEIPAGFDWAYFQAAPDDQQLALLRGDEWIELEGLHPRYDVFRTQLPGVHVMACLYGVPGGAPFELHLDRVTLYPDRDVVTLCFRSNVPLRDEATLGRAVLAVAEAPLGATPNFPASSAELSVQHPEREAARKKGSPLTGTIEISGEIERESVPFPVPSPHHVPSPFPVASPSSGRTGSAPPGSPWSREAARPVAPPAVSFTSTVSMVSDEVAEALRILDERDQREAAPLAAEPAPSDEPPDAKAARLAAEAEAERRRAEDARRFQEDQERLAAAEELRRRRAAEAKQEKASRIMQSLYNKKRS